MPPFFELATEEVVALFGNGRGFFAFLLSLWLPSESSSSEKSPSESLDESSERLILFFIVVGGVLELRPADTLALPAGTSELFNGTGGMVCHNDPLSAENIGIDGGLGVVVLLGALPLTFDLAFN